ncbi:helix-turn-helix domain-containing protein [Meridianimarinicoccus aquatilis]|nr:AraC family transcriptional regulator [Fluviibacterium aquatile]
MQRKMVNLVEMAQVIELIGKYAPRSVIDKALRSAGLDRAMLSGTTGFISYASEAVLVETVARTIGDRHLGARIGRDFDYSAYGAFSHFVLGAPDLASAFDRGRRAFLFTHPGSEIILRKTETHIVVGRNSKGFSVVGHQHIDEGALFVIGHVVRHFLGPDWRPDWVEIPNANANETAELASLIDAPVRIGSQMPAIAIRRADFLALNPGPPEQQRTMSLKELGDLMGIEPAQTMEETVVQLLHVTLAKGPLSEEAAAKLLAVGTRTLQRALKAEGTSFRKLRLRFIEQHARSLLSGTDMPIEDISKVLGYSEPRSFRRVFNGWTGLSPSAFRAANAQK